MIEFVPQVHTQIRQRSTTKKSKIANLVFQVITAWKDLQLPTNSHVLMVTGATLKTNKPLWYPCTRVLKASIILVAGYLLLLKKHALYVQKATFVKVLILDLQIVCQVFIVQQVLTILMSSHVQEEHIIQIQIL